MRERTWEDVSHDARRNVSAEISGLMRHLEMLPLPRNGDAHCASTDGEDGTVEWKQIDAYFPLLPHRKASTLMVSRTEKVPLTDTPKDAINYRIHDLLLDYGGDMQEANMVTTSVYKYRKNNRGIARSFTVASQLVMEDARVICGLGEFESSGLTMPEAPGLAQTYTLEGRFGELDVRDAERVRGAVAHLLLPMLKS